MKNNMILFGSILKKYRMERDFSIRDICKIVGYDASNWSKIERGLLPPPTDERVLDVWASALKILKKDIRKFKDNAAIAQGIIPRDIIENKNIISLMPAFFRTIRGNKPKKEDIDDLFKVIQ